METSKHEALLDALSRVVGAVGGESRPSQQTLAVAVADAIASGEHLIAEAGTGSGKSFAYLVPALRSGKRVVIATATKNLQDQLWAKDLPIIERNWGSPVRAALLKGRGNYLCLAKLYAAQHADALFNAKPSVTFADDLDFLTEWANECETGDEAELVYPVPTTSWNALTCAQGECPGAAKCSYGSDCFAERARARAADADIVIVNTALYCAHIASGGYVLPEHDVVIFDEAHEVPEIATRAFSLELSPARLRFLAGRVRNAVGVEHGDAIAKVAQSLAEALAGAEGRVDPTRDPLAARLVQAGEVLARAGRKLQEQIGDTDGGAVTSRQTFQLLANTLEGVRCLAAPQSGDVVWIEGDPPVLQSAPIEIGSRFRTATLDRVTTIMVSATLGTGERFETFARACGFDPTVTTPPEAASVGSLPSVPPTSYSDAYVAHRFASPFDYQQHAYLYCSKHLPDPRSSDWYSSALAETRALIAAANGRTLMLCTSHASAQRFAADLRTDETHPVLAQGDMPKGQLVAAFLADPESVLVATRSFWQGVDVPGEACILVIIDKLPFARPDDPLETARRDLVTERGGNAFREVDLPRAALALAQGSGRLIRTATDRGVVAVLDSRLATAGYRSILLNALPPFKRSVNRAEVEDFLRSITNAQ
jgi:ATP-dependent DNA helicase DinG